MQLVTAGCQTGRASLGEPALSTAAADNEAQQPGAESACQRPRQAATVRASESSASAVRAVSTSGSCASSLQQRWDAALQTPLPADSEVSSAPAVSPVRGRGKRVAAVPENPAKAQRSRSPSPRADAAACSTVAPVLMVKAFDPLTFDTESQVSLSRGSPAQRPACAAVPARPKGSVRTASSVKKPRAKSVQPVRQDQFTSKVPAGLRPQVPGHVAARVTADGQYQSSLAEKAHHAEFFNRKPELAMLRQETHGESLIIWDPSLKKFLKPELVMVDSGALVTLLISKPYAEALGLTWKPGTAPLVGIGGPGGSLGRADQHAIVQLGGDVKVAPTHSSQVWEGRATIRIRPIVITHELCNYTGCQCIVGQGFIRPLLGSVNPYTERFEYSPAWLTHGCAEFRVSVPLSMSEPAAGLLGEHGLAASRGDMTAHCRAHCAVAALDKQDSQ